MIRNILVKLISFTIIASLIWSGLFAQTTEETDKTFVEKEKVLQQAIAAAETGAEKVAGILDIVSFYRTALYRDSTLLNKALPYIDQGVRICLQQNFKEELYLLKLEQVGVYSDIRKTDELKLMLQTETDSVKTEILRSLSRIYNSDPFDDPKAATQYAQDFLVEAERLKSIQLQINANNQLGYVHYVRYELEKAKACFWKAIQLADNKKYNNIGVTFFFLAKLYSTQGKQDSAKIVGALGVKYFTDSYDKTSLVKVYQEAPKDSYNEELVGELRKNDIAQQAAIERSADLTKAGLLFALVLSLIIGLLFRQYKSNQSTAVLIDKKNAAMAKIVQEKEWLLKEVHHRVKNNLQTVVSLLESQSHFLNAQALDANLESQNRLYIMSLVHQKMYAGDNIAAIEIKDYIRDIVNYFSMNLSGAKLRFSVDVCPLNLDVSQAIPLGLILNESVMMASKTQSAADVHIIDLKILIKQSTNSDCLFEISSDTSKLFCETGEHSKSSQPLTLIRSMVAEMDGQLAIRSEEGSAIQVRFTPRNLLRSTRLMSDIHLN